MPVVDVKPVNSDAVQTEGHQLVDPTSRVAAVSKVDTGAVRMAFHPLRDQITRGAAAN